MPSFSAGGAAAGGLAAVPWGRLLAAMVLVAMFMAVLLFYVRLLRGRLPGRPHLLQVVAMVGVGPKERLMLVHVDHKVLLLGVTAGGITKLHEFDESLLQEVHGPGQRPGWLARNWKGLRDRQQVT